MLSPPHRPPPPTTTSSSHDLAAIGARDEFLSAASHELRGPLSALELRLQTLVRMSRPGSRVPLSNDQLHEKLEAASSQAR